MGSFCTSWKMVLAMLSSAPVFGLGPLVRGTVGMDSEATFCPGGDPRSWGWMGRLSRKSLS